MTKDIINWGDGSKTNVSKQTIWQRVLQFLRLKKNPYAHTYKHKGTHTVTIKGGFGEVKEDLIKLVKEAWIVGEIEFKTGQTICVKHDSSYKSINQIAPGVFYYSCAVYPCKEYELKDGKFHLTSVNKGIHSDASKWDLTKCTKIDLSALTNEEE